MKKSLIFLFALFLCNTPSSEKNKECQKNNLDKLAKIVAKQEGPAAYIVAKIFGMQPNQKAKDNFANLTEKKSN